MRSSTRGSTAISTALFFSVPYTIAGILPLARSRRASFLPRPSRGSALSVASIYLVPFSALYEQRRNRRFLVDAANRLTQQARDGELLDLAADLRPIRHQRDRVGDDHLIDRRLLEPIDRRAGEHAVHGAREHALGPVGLERIRRLHDCARRV